MEFLSGLALVLLTLAGYSAGAAISSKGRKVTPELLDIAGVVALWGMALATRGWLGKWLAIGVWIVLGLAVGAVGVALRRERYPTEKAEAMLANVRGLKRLWESWKALGLRMGNYQSRVLLALFYFLMVTPFGVGVRAFSDPLRMKARSAESAWVTREKSGTDLESTRSQF